MSQLPRGTLIHDEVHGASYRLRAKLGQGGFGTAYRAIELNRNGGEKRGSGTCIKLSSYADEWHGEVYFAGLLRDVGHVVEMKSAFPTSVFSNGKMRTVFAINMELVDGGTVRDECDRVDGGWSEEQVCRRVRLLLKPLELLHGMGVSHRDVTPPNVFVGNRKVLKLGDFGITKAQLKPAGVYADVLNPAFAPKDLGVWWRPADDVYQIGLLMATLVSGKEFYTGVRKPEVNTITSKGKLREAIKAAISVKAQRPQTARDLSALLA